MSQILIKNIKHTEKVSKSGKDYISCMITTWSSREQKDVHVSGFGDEITKTWNPGDTVDITITQNDRGYYNFEQNENTKASPNQMIVLLEKILAELKSINFKHIQSLANEFNGTIVEEKKEEQKTGDVDEISLDDIPF